MLYIVPTKNGIGVELWGTFDDIRSIHSVVQNFWGSDENRNRPDFDNRDKAISSFSRELRKTHEGSRLKRKKSHFSFEEADHYGCRFTWVHIIISLAALRFNMRYQETDKFDLSYFMQIEFWLEKSALNYDEKGGKELTPYFNGAIYGGASHLYQLLLSLDIEFLRLQGGKRAFRKLPQMLKRATYFSQEYNEYEDFLKKETTRLSCEIKDLEIDVDDIDYDNIKW